jgi:hypothetical protein
MPTTKLTVELVNISIEADDVHSAATALMARIGKAMQQFSGGDELPQVAVDVTVKAGAEPVAKHPLSTAPTPAPRPKGKRSPVMLACVEKPEWRGTVQDAAALVGCKVTSVHTAIWRGGPIGGLTFRKLRPDQVPPQTPITFECNACCGEVVIDSGDEAPTRCMKCGASMTRRAQ